MEFSKKILEIALWDKTMRYRLANVTDLIAAEGKYHLPCYRTFARKYTDKNGKIKSTFAHSTPEDIALDNTVDELMRGLSLHKVYSLPTVWERYCQFLRDFNVEPGVYRSNRFKSKLEKLLDGHAEIINPLNQQDPLLIFPPVLKSVAMETLLEKK